MRSSASSLSKLTTSVSEYTILVAVALLPLLAIPATNDFISDTKHVILFVSALFVVALYGVHVITERTFKITLSPFSTALTWFGLGTLGATFLTSQYPHESLLGFGGVYLASTILAAFGSMLISKRTLPLFPLILAASGVVLSITTILQFAGVGPSWAFNSLFNLNLPHTVNFNLADSPLIAFQLLSVTLVGWIASYITTKQKSTFLFSGVTLVLAAGLCISLYSILPGRPAAPALPSFGATWSIALDVLRTPRTAILGVGPSTFSQTYNLFKPLWVNTTPNWNVEFSQGFNAPMSLLVTLGVVGFGAWLFLAYQILRRLRSVDIRELPSSWMLVAFLAFQLIFPPHVILFGLFGITLAFWLAAQASSFEQVKLHTLITRINPKSEVPSTSTTHFMAWLTGIGLVLISAAGLYGTGRAYAASNSFHRSFSAAQANDVTRMYELQQQAVRLNPYQDDYRRTLALSNLNIAILLTNQPDATEEDRAQALQFIQEAIREGRSSTLIQPGEARNWQALGQVYRAIVGSIEGADQWALNTYVRAIEAAPTNPDLRVELGSLFYQQQLYQDSIQLFQQALQLKPDHLNAQYNLANAFRMAGYFTEAEGVYKQILPSISPETPDYALIQAELKQTQAAMATQSAQPAQGLNNQSLVDESLNLNPQSLNQPQTNQETNQLLNQSDFTASPSPSPSSQF